MKHLVVVTTSFPDTSFHAGQEAAGMFVDDFVAELSKQARVTAVAPSRRENIEQINNVTIHRFAVPSLPLSLLKPTNPLQWSHIINTLRAGRQAVGAILKGQTVDHILALWALPSGYWVRTAAQESGVPYSIWALGSDIWSLGKIPLVRRVLQSVLRDSQHRFADGYQLADDVTAICGLDCAFLPSTRKLQVTAEKQLATAPPYRLCFLGRWHPHKGVDLLLEALHLLNDDDWQKIDSVQICGGGPLEALVYKQCEVLQGNGRSVTVRGYLDRDEATELFIWADYLLLPSRIESIPVIFSDAMQTGCPVITTPVGDLPRLLTTYHAGILSTTVSSQSITGALRSALNRSPEFYRQGLQKALKDFNINCTVDRLMKSLNWLH